ncbi:MAG: type IVB secretion system protein IcmH/DotU [Candidatus Competibacteraceae bacterium]|nr:type IVB secretion system protein IcmH/DotU [Candidatus Competibacteraceae bacterium]
MDPNHLESGDRTIVRPTPGGRSAPARSAQAPLPPSGQAPVRASAGGGLNALVGAAAHLLALLTRLKNTAAHPDPGGLRQQLIQEIRAFEERCRTLGVDSNTTNAARYVLCTVLDEMVRNTPWGSQDPGWNRQSLLITFHNEGSGGERFFVLLERLLREPQRHLDLLELMYLCLALGFEGRYNVLPGGRDQVASIRERLYHTLRNQRGEFERDLSPHWQGVENRVSPLTRLLPLWVAAALAGLVLLGVFLTLNIQISTQSDPVFAALHALGEENVSLVERLPWTPPPLQSSSLVQSPPMESGSLPVCLGRLLADQVHDDLIQVEEQAQSSLIRIRGDGLFASGQVRVKEDYLPLLNQVAAALKQVEGQVLVTGHTDNIPIRTLRFPSNFELSQARAEAVRTILAQATGQPERFEAEGRSDTEPLTSNATREGRARNRRVELALFHQGCQS